MRVGELVGEDGEVGNCTPLFQPIVEEGLTLVIGRWLVVVGRLTWWVSLGGGIASGVAFYLVRVILV